MRLLILLTAVAGCMPDISATLDAGPCPEGAEEVVADVSTTVVVTDSGLEVPITIAQLVVDATDYDNWVYIDLSVPEENSSLWQLAFKRFEVELGSNVDAAILDGVPIEEAYIPDDGWQVDLPDEDDDGKPERVFDEWYDYDYETHTLTPKPLTYIVRDPEAAYAVAFEAYYDDAGTSGVVSLRLRVL